MLRLHLKGKKTMSKGQVNTLALEVEELLRIYGRDHWHTIEAIVQIVDREKILAINKERRKNGEPEIIPEPQRYQGQKGTWIIDVPQEWISLPQEIDPPGALPQNKEEQ